MKAFLSSGGRLILQTCSFLDAYTPSCRDSSFKGSSWPVGKNVS